MTNMLKVNAERLKSDIESLAAIGRDDENGGGIYRMAFSDGDMAGRQWLRESIATAGLDLHVDGAANVHGRLAWDGEAASVMTGSHIDTVPGAGHLDGALGVLCGLEALRTIKESEIDVARPLELVAFSDEEGRFGGMFGSQSISGEVTEAWIDNARDLSGLSLTDAMAERHMNALDALGAARAPESLHAYVELHIEQGPVLDRKGVPIGVVEGICGLRRWEVRFGGIANHAGTTPMSMRNDAFQGLAAFAGEIDAILEKHGGPLSVATIGRVELTPGAANVVPGQAVFALEFRDTHAATLDALSEAFRACLEKLAEARALTLDIDVLSKLAPVACDDGVRGIIDETAGELGLERHTMPSGAAHDCQKLARITRAGMIFVPSSDGRSHSSAEWTDWDDIEAGANVLLNTLHRLATEERRA